LPSWYSLVLSDKKFIEYITKFVKPFLLDIVLLDIFLFLRLLSFTFCYIHFNILIYLTLKSSSIHQLALSIFLLF
jgi:hypothetical protein